jgi:hypothetical protein
VKRGVSRRRRKSKKQKRECLVFREVTFWYWDCFLLLYFA